MIRIIADSTCSLSREVLNSRNIKIAPYSVIIDKKVVEDYKDLSPDEFYQELKLNKEKPIVVTPRKTKFLELFTEDWINGIEEFIVITTNSYKGGSYDVAVQAKKEFLETHKKQKIKIEVIDSKCVAHGYGYLVLKAAIMKDNFMKFKDIVNFIEKNKTKVKHFSAVEDLENLSMTETENKHGIKQNELAVLTANKGGMGIIGGVRGKSVFSYAAEEFANTNDMDTTDFVIIGYTSDEDYANEMKEVLVKEANYRSEILIMQMESTAGAQMGLNGVGIYYMSKNKDSQFADMYVQLGQSMVRTA